MTYLLIIYRLHCEILRPIDGSGAQRANELEHCERMQVSVLIHNASMLVMYQNLPLLCHFVPCTPLP